MRLAPIFFDRVYIRRLLLALLLALPIANLLFITLIQKSSPLFSYSRVVIAILVWAILTAILYYMIFAYRKFIHGKYISNQKLAIFIVVSILLAVSFYNDNHIDGGRLFNTLLYPQQTIIVTALDQKNPASTGYAVTLLGFDNDFGYVSYSKFRSTSEWLLTENNEYVLKSSERPATFTWRGRTGDHAFMDFLTGPDAGLVEIRVNDEPGREIDLYSPEPDRKRFQAGFPIPILDRFTTTLSELIFLLIILFMVMVGLSCLPSSERQSVPQKGAWLLYALPMVLVWLLGLLALYPGLVGSDSTVHFHQAWRGELSDKHSVLYTLILRGLTGYSHTTPAVAVVQILSLAIVTAWGLRIYDRMRSPIWVPWAVSGMMAFALPNILNIISYFQDIPYSISIYTLTVILLHIVFSKGAWLDNKINILILGVVSTFVILFRKNGMFVPIVSFIAIVVLYKDKWKGVLAAFMITMISYGVFTGPVYRILGVNSGMNNTNPIILHHLGAHVSGGTPLTKEEQDFLFRVMPVGEWVQYDCRIVNTLWYNEKIDREYMNQNYWYALRLMLRLFTANPGVDINHMVCASSMVWSIQPRAYLYESAYDLISGTWVVDNPLNIRAESKIPALAAWITTVYQYIDEDKHIRYILTWRPAIPLLASIAFCIILVIRRRNNRYLLILTPILVHTLTLLLVSIAQDYRYQYPVLPVAIFLSGFVFIPLRGESDLVDLK